MATYEGSGGSEPITGATRSLEEVTPAEFMAAQVNPGRPSWMKTRYPVSMEEFDKLNEAANLPDPTPFAAAAAVPDAIEDRGHETEQAELPEDETAIQALAPTQISS